MKLRIQAALLTTALLLTPAIQPAQAASFTDVPKSHWAHDPIDVISDLGIINGYPDGTYKLNQPVTRAQAAKIVALATKTKPTHSFTPDFKDVTPAHGSYDHIRALTERGIFNNGEAFNPNASLTRGQMAKIITLAYNIIVDDNDEISFSDVKKINGYHSYITTIAELGITTTAQGGEFKPNDPVSRAHMAAFIHRAIEFDNKRKTGEIYYDQAQRKYVEKVYSIPEPPPAQMDESLAVQTINLVNKERQQQNLATLKQDDELSAIAQIKAEDMAKNNYFAHNSPTYGTVGNMLDQFGYDWMGYGENIAKGYTTAETVVQGWMESPGHRANILQSHFTNIGTGYATDQNGTTYWVHMFSTK
ncbi:S-layer homology domain-containing protein [Sporosarcina sp. ACRSL]|uniref:CAP and S-layer homology domain-containing protein n=1 Tax=Sporosarcina sp. ACRSL TaxID=2918215 RepID=UPI001EF5D1B1|nr:S-layer homology domain-containing protein [Sporosarcina sp. ACRSL]MCG7343964.1 S-layer homology domain-containing protein [Sporosarcina sp. ACRSL]